MLAGNPGRWVGERQAAYLGGPDLVVEVLSPGDEAPAKLPFYAALGVREVLMIDPDIRRVGLWRLVGGAFQAVRGVLRSEVTGLEYAATAAGLEIHQPATGRTWNL